MREGSSCGCRPAPKACRASPPARPCRSLPPLRGTMVRSTTTGRDSCPLRTGWDAAATRGAIPGSFAVSPRLLGHRLENAQVQ